MRWVGFSDIDLVEFLVALVFVALAGRTWIERAVRWLAARPAFSMAFLAALPVALRLALVPQNPIPTLNVSDDFSYLLIADTLRHLRLANPAHPFHHFFETFFVLQDPFYASIFPLGQGLILAIGWTLFGHPWAGVALSIGALAALCYWMLRGWITPEWALVGGLLAAIEFGPLNQWMNSYWGGAVAACAGCLVFGALPRLRAMGRRREAALLGIGIALAWLCRPYETIFLLIAVIAFLLPNWRLLVKPVLFAIPFLALSLLQNKQVTGSWATLPYQLSQYQYGVPTTFTVQPLPTPHRTLTREQQLDFQVQSDAHGPGTDTLVRYWERWLARIGFYRFFFLPALFLIFPFFLLRLKERRFIWLAITILLFSLGTNFYPYFYPHYIAALTCLFVLVSVVGLQRLNQWNGQSARIVLFLCSAHFLLWYGIRVSRNQEFYEAFAPLETSDAINSGDPEGRIAIQQRLETAAGRQLVFVRYGPQHAFQEWVHNAADIDHSPIVWARDLGADENQKLLRYYPDRTAWLLEPDAHPPRISVYQR